MTDKSPLAAYRKDKGISLQKLAERLDVNKSTILRWEAGKIPAERVRELEEVTGIPRHKLRADLYGTA